MKIKKTILYLIIIFSVLTVISCGLEPNTLRFDIISSGDSFHGYYKIDDDDNIYFDYNETTYIKGFYEYTKTIELDSQIIIYAVPKKDGNVTSVNYLSIQVIENNKIVAIDEPLTNPIIFAKVIYTLEDEDTE